MILIYIFKTEIVTTFNILKGETHNCSFPTLAPTVVPPTDSVNSDDDGKRDSLLLIIYIVVPVVFGLIFAAGIFVALFPRYFI